VIGQCGFQEEVEVTVEGESLVITKLKPNCDPNGRADLGTAALEGLPGTLLDKGLNDRLRTIAAKHRAKVVEIFGPFFLDPSGLIADDCIHPNDAGHAVILQAAIAAFEGN
jgi:hypothetical protein